MNTGFFGYDLLIMLQYFGFQVASNSHITPVDYPTDRFELQDSYFRRLSDQHLFPTMLSGSLF